jgi:2-aminophenol/2-amino-5-chlorophenol 1,6-dioxygenase alpha subunit
MPVVSAFLVHGSPLPFLRPENPPWKALDTGYRAAAAALAASKPDVMAVYSTQWIAVLDELWQARPRSRGVHVDENWHEYGDLAFDIRADVELTKAIIAATPAFGVRSKPVDYDGFPIDTGTIIANNYLNPRGILPLVIAANNVYHDWQTTEKLAATAVACAESLGRRVALVAVGGLSGSIIREEIDLARDRIASKTDDAWNRRMLALIVAGNSKALAEACPKYAQEARVDMGFKHFAWILGGLGGRYLRAKVHAYGPCYGSGAAIIEFTPVVSPALKARSKPAVKPRSASKALSLAKRAAKASTTRRSKPSPRSARRKVAARPAKRAARAATRRTKR